MDELRITVHDTPAASGFKRFNEHRSHEFRKIRFKSSDTTVDVAAMPVEGEVDKRIEDRQQELQSMELHVPSPYTAEIESHQQDAEHPIEFHDNDGTPFGVGYADPEYRLLMEDMHQIPRYRYVVTWRYFPAPAILAEIEVYLSLDEDPKDALQIADNITVEKTEHTQQQFPQCCSSCEHREAVTGTCNQDEDQLLRRHFLKKPDQSCPRHSRAE